MGKKCEGGDEEVKVMLLGLTESCLDWEEVVGRAGKLAQVDRETHSVFEGGWMRGGRRLREWRGGMETLGAGGRWRGEWRMGCFCLWLVVLIGSGLFGGGLAVGDIPAVLEVNFETENTGGCASGIAVDIGEAFGDRFGHLRYGWLLADSNLPVNAKMNTRNLAASLDESCVARTFIHMQYGDCCMDKPLAGVTKDVVWKIEVPNGMYRVTAVCGDPSNVEAIYSITVNGVSVIPPQAPTTQKPEVRGSNIITVTTEELTLSAQDDGVNTKLSYVKIEKVAISAAADNTCVPFPSAFSGQAISTLPCEAIKVDAPYIINYGVEVPPNGLVDKNGVSTGFTMYIASSYVLQAYDPSLLEVRDGSLKMSTTEGRLNKNLNTQINALGCGLPLPDFDLKVFSKFIIPSDVENKYERACMYVAVSDRDNVKVCYAGTQRGETVFVHYEREDKKVYRKYRLIKLDETREIAFWFELYPLLDEIKIFFQIGTADPVEYMTVYEGTDLFNKDAAGTDFTVGTRSFAGVFVSHAFSEKTLVYDLKEFKVEKLDRKGDTVNFDSVDFDTAYIPGLSYPTSLIYGPDSKLYVGMADGKLARVELDHNTNMVISRSVFEPIGTRLLLGVAVDPESTPENMIIWLCHSDASQSDGSANSGMITKVTGPNLDIVEDVITGLPRAIANHAPNSLKFGPDGRLFIAVGGNTAGGTPNDDLVSDFGFRPEQCLSAALLVADVKAPGFNGACSPSQDPNEMDATGIADECDYQNMCDVQIYASGTRNPYDFYFYNGHLYMTDNGLGGRGTFPHLPDDYLPGDPCHGPIFGDDIPAHDPKNRDDILIDVVEGGFYGHPNPTRRECVYYGANPTKDVDFLIPRSPISEGKSWSLQMTRYPVGTNPDPRYKPAMFSLGRSHSANGIIVYESNAFCGHLRGEILTTFYSQEDQVLRVTLSQDGTSVVNDETLVKTTEDTGATERLHNPLAITQDPHGNIYIAEFFAGRVRILDPIGTECSVRLETSESSSSGPAGLHHIGSASFKNSIFSFGGLRDGAATDEVHMFDIYHKRWTVLEKLPTKLSGGSAVHVGEGSILVVGGRDVNDSPMSSVYEFDAKTKSVREMVDMPGARSGATVARVGEKVYVMGGVDEYGVPTSTVFVLDLRTSVWMEEKTMLEVRQGAVSSVVEDILYVCGGFGQNGGELCSCESFEGQSWTPIPSMKTGRAHAGMVSVDGKLIVKGGELASGNITDAVEEFDPSSGEWRELSNMSVGHSAGAVLRVGTAIYSIGGKSQGGKSFDGEIFYYK